MKRWIIFIILCSLSRLSALACGPYYPYGDDVRFRLLYPEGFAYNDFCNFHYTAGFGYTPHSGGQAQRDSQLSADVRAGTAQNIALWKTYCRNQADETSINEAVYELPLTDLYEKKSSNAMVRYLQAKDTAALRYLQFAKMCEKANAFYSDPWERETENIVPGYSRQILGDAVAYSNLKNLNADLRLRYAFLAIRLAYYQYDTSTLCKVYEQHFSKRQQKNILDYWSLYFRLMYEPDSVKRNYEAAMVFYYAPDKRVPVYNFFVQKMSVAPVLTLARNKEEQGALWLAKGVQEPGRALHILKQVYACDPASRGFGELLLREVNKLEDWIYTPYLTRFDPSVIPGEEDNRWWKQSGERDQNNRIYLDRLYASNVLDFLGDIAPAKLADPQLYHIARAYLLCMTMQYDEAILALKNIQNQGALSAQTREQLAQINAFCLTARQETGKAIVADAVKPVLLRAEKQYNYRFLFAIARELEFKGNTKDAALLFSKLNAVEIDTYNEGEHTWDNIVSWRTKKGHNTLWLDFYTDCFFYLDAVYTPEQLQEVITAIEQHKTSDSFSTWLYASITPKRERLYDLLGTKYIRQNKLEPALAAFRNVSDKVWNDSAYYFWECLAANPFYTNMYQEHQPSKADSVRMTKTQITEQLIRHLELAGDPRRKDRDYHYFIAANCYLNMTQYGNSWMMRRYYWTSDANETGLEDDKEYYECNLAKQYYLKAKELSRSKKFSALCLGMAGRCEKYRLYNLEKERRYDDKVDQEVFAKNQLYRRLKREYPAYYEDLMSNCTAFERYFAARK